MRKRLKKRVVHKTVQAWADRGLTQKKVSSSWCWKMFGYNRGILIHVDFAADTITDYTLMCLAHLDVCRSTGLPGVVCTQVL
jgi:hypothetical protein